MLSDLHIHFSMQDFWNEHEEAEEITIADVAQWVAEKMTLLGIPARYISPNTTTHIIALPNVDGVIPTNGWTRGFCFSGWDTPSYTLNLVTSVNQTNANFSSPGGLVYFENGEYVSYTSSSADAYCMYYDENRYAWSYREWRQSTDLSKGAADRYAMHFDFVIRRLTQDAVLFVTFRDAYTNMPSNLAQYKGVNGVVLTKCTDIVTNEKINGAIWITGFDSSSNNPNISMLSEKRGSGVVQGAANLVNDTSFIDIRNVVFRGTKFDNIYYTYAPDNAMVSEYFSSESLYSAKKILRNGIIDGDDHYCGMIYPTKKFQILLFKNVEEVDV